MVDEKARKNKDWEEYVGKECKLVYEDGVEQDGKPHYSTKRGIVDKVTKTHFILKERGRHVAINLLKVLRVEMD